MGNYLEEIIIVLGVFEPRRGGPVAVISRRVFFLQMFFTGRDSRALKRVKYLCTGAGLEPPFT